MELESSPAFRALADHQLARALPALGMIEITFRCNLDCRHCYLVEGRVTRSPRLALGRDELIALLEQLAELGVFQLTLSGGEFFVSPFAWDVLDAAARLGFAVRLFSALAALPPERLDRLLDTTVFVVETSLHGADAATHDAFTQRPGSFERTLASMRRLRALEVPVVAKTCWTRRNWRQAGAILDLCDELGADFRGTCFVQPRDDGSTDNLSLRLTDDEYLQFCRAMLERDGVDLQAVDQDLRAWNGLAAESALCGAGRTSFRIDPYGDVYPCVEVGVSSGNVRERPFAEIWSGGASLQRMRSLTLGDLEFQGGSAYDHATVGGCAVCPGANLKENGSLTAVSEEGKRLARLAVRARDSYLADRGAPRGRRRALPVLGQPPAR